jgi:ubiquinone/menaquinone biosynthesis C-methylase UbiE
MTISIQQQQQTQPTPTAPMTAAPMTAAPMTAAPMTAAPMTAAQAYRLLAPSYDDSYQMPFAKAEDAIIFGQLRELVTPDDRVLDIGCGTGNYPDHMPHAQREYVGVDLISEMVEIAQAKHPTLQFVVGDMARLAFSTGEFTVAVNLFGPFGYTSEPHRAISEMLRVLAPGGRFFLMAYGPRYARRPSYIINRNQLSVPSRRYRAQDIRQLFVGQPVRDLHIQGFHAFAETRFPGHTQGWYETYLLWEMRTLGQFIPNLCYFLLVSGSRL